MLLFLIVEGNEEIRTNARVIQGDGTTTLPNLNQLQ